MQPALVAIDDDDSDDANERLLREAGRTAAGTGRPLVLLAWVTRDEVEQNAETLQSMSDAMGGSFDASEARDVVSRFVADAAEEAFAEVDGDVDYETMSVVTDGDPADAILDAAAERDCDHVYVTGRKRSPTGKALFGDTAQQVVLDFDGFVTVATR
ncbi:universal stress protein [Candidatus Halobonum tyrrellensis]|uniref:UspA domain protein n=1 Tax=Candidatus Halobonum tyrrellensis G22 TaxID=1324957 RepID=V4IUV0_9EURY|nr:universal stress protein [Candidatus Halobonum tyrrellensis]ESP86977.1 uspA domain protein [Candidatus Halobonum tyrrellensis G22]